MENLPFEIDKNSNKVYINHWKRPYWASLGSRIFT